MIYFIRFHALLDSFYSIFCPWVSLAVENIILRQRLVSLKQKDMLSQKMPFTHMVLKWLSRFLPGLLIKLHRKACKLYWKLISRNNAGRPEIDLEIRLLIKQMVSDNPTWGAPRVHGELLKLGFVISERSVSRYLNRFKPIHYSDGSPGWLVFIKNQSKWVAAMDFCVVSTLLFKPLYTFFIIGHDRRELIHFGVTFHPTALWVSNQIKEAFGSGKYAHIKYMIHDRDTIFSSLVVSTLQSLGIQSRRTDYRSPWQNGIAERWVGSCRRELLDHVIILNERHLYRLLEEYKEYYNKDRTHYSLGKDPPITRPVQERESDDDKVIALPRIGGLHHKYVWKKAA